MKQDFFIILSRRIHVHANNHILSFGISLCDKQQWHYSRGVRKGKREGEGQKERRGERRGREETLNKHQRQHQHQLQHQRQHHQHVHLPQCVLSFHYFEGKRVPLQYYGKQHPLTLDPCFAVPKLIMDRKRYVGWLVVYICLLYPWKMELGWR